MQQAFTAYLEQYALVSLEKQDRMAMLIGEHLHELDLDAGTIRFSSELVFPMQVLGTESDNTVTWLWAWADEQTEIPDNLLDASRRLRDWGSKEGLNEFTSPSIDLDRADGNAIALIASQVAGASCFYRDSYEGGAVYLLLFDKTIDSRPSFDRTRLVRGLSDILSRYDLNHRNTLESYFRLKGLSPSAQDLVISCELDSGERLVAEFDRKGRLTKINGAPFLTEPE